jgi:diacylglycerol kinase family enzyme
MAQMKHIFIINPRHFQKKSDIDRIIYQIESDFLFGKIADYEINISKYRRDSIGLIDKRINEPGPDKKIRVYAIGGDGILFDCLNGVANTNAELACVPYGWNDFIRTFGKDNIPAFRTISHQINAPVFPIDIFSCNENYALNHCVIGLSGSVALTAKEIIDAYGKVLSIVPNYKRHIYHLGRAISFFNKNVREQHYTVSIDGKDYSGNYSSIFIANGQCYDYNKIPAPNARIADGKLDVFLVKSMSAPVSLLKWRAFQFGKIPESSNLLTVVPARNIDIESKANPLNVSLDGVAFYESRLSIRIHPQAVNFVIPGTVQRTGSL